MCRRSLLTAQQTVNNSNDYHHRDLNEQLEQRRQRIVKNAENLLVQFIFFSFQNEIEYNKINMQNRKNSKRSFTAMPKRKSQSSVLFV